MRIAAAILAIATPLSAQQRAASPVCATCRIERVASCPGRFLEGINVDRQGLLWALSLQDGGILRIGSDGRCTQVAATGGIANGAKFADDGRLLITDKARGLLAFDPRAGKVSVVSSGYGAENYRGLNDLYPDGRGGFYVTEPYGSDTLHPTGRLFHVALGPATTITLVADNIAFPNGVAVSLDGQTVYVAEFARQQILALPSLAFKGPFGIAMVIGRMEGGHPDGLLVDQAGRIYAAGFGAGTVSIFDPSGILIDTVHLPSQAGRMVTNMAIAKGFLYVTEAERGEVWRITLRD